jgi:hypothetical protein
MRGEREKDWGYEKKSDKKSYERKQNNKIY